MRVIKLLFSHTLIAAFWLVPVVVAQQCTTTYNPPSNPPYPSFPKWFFSRTLIIAFIFFPAALAHQCTAYSITVLQAIWGFARQLFQILARRGLLLLPLLLGSRAIAQTVTYPFPNPQWPFSSFAPTIPTTVNETVNTVGCQNPADNTSSSQTFGATENVYPPLWYARPYTPWSPGYDGVNLSFNVSPPGDPLTFINGVSEGEGTVKQTVTSGTYPAGVGTGVGAKGTYSMTVAGNVITDQYVLMVQYFTTTQKRPGDLYTIVSTYNVVSGVQTYTFSLSITQIDIGPGTCVSTSQVNESGSGTANYYVSGLQINTALLADGKVGTNYLQGNTASAGTQPYTWSWSATPSSGTVLPPGLSIDPSSGLISGKPTQAGQFPVTITVQDSTGSTASKQFQLTVNSATCTVKVSPSYSQAASPWGPTTYDHTTGQFNHMKELGCGTTALAMAVHFACSEEGNKGITPPVPCSSVDPGVLNAFMNTHFDYTQSSDTKQNGNVLFPQTVLDISGGTLMLDNLGSNASHAGTTQEVDDALCGNNGQTAHPVIVQVHGISHPNALGHYVLITGKKGDTYSIVDPGCRQAIDLSSTFSCPSATSPNRTVSYGNSYVVVGVVKDPPNRSELDISVPNAAIQVTDPNGFQTAFNPTTSQTSNGIPHSAYLVSYLDNDLQLAPIIGPAHSIQIPQPALGVFRVVFTGLAKGDLTVAMAFYDQNGQQQTLLSEVVTTQPGSTSTYLINEDSTPGAKPTITAMPGDRNGDGIVDCTDLAIVKASFGKTVGQLGFDPRADVNGDGIVNVIDLRAVASQLPSGTTCK